MVGAQEIEEDADEFFLLSSSFITCPPLLPLLPPAPNEGMQWIGHGGAVYVGGEINGEERRGAAMGHGAVG